MKQKYEEKGYDCVYKPKGNKIPNLKSKAVKTLPKIVIGLEMSAPLLFEKLSKVKLHDIFCNISCTFKHVLQYVQFQQNLLLSALEHSYKLVWNVDHGEKLWKARMS